MFWSAKELSAEVLVRPDGKISLPILNDLPAAGMTPEQLAGEIAKAATKFVRDPSATVIVKEVNSRKVYVVGEVSKPGPIVLGSEMNVLQAIGEAGGFLETAKKGDVVVVRTENGKERRYKFNYNEVVREKMSSRTSGSCRATQSSFASVRALAVALLVMTAEGAAAQTVTSGGLFGATRNDAGGREKLNLQLTMAGAFDSDVPPEFQSVAGRNDLLVGNRSALVAGSTEFERNRHSVQLFGDAATRFRYVQDLDQIAAGSQHGRLGLGFRLPHRGNLEVTQAGAYSPSYLYDLLPAVTPQPPGEAVPGSPEYQIDQTESLTYTTNTALTFGSARGTLLTTTAEYGFVNYKDPTIGLPDRATYMVGTRLSKALSRKLAVSAGYDYEAGEFGVDTLSMTHRVTIGVEYSPPLSVTRRVTFRLDLSPSVFQVPESALPSVADGKVYPMQGEASVDYPFHLKWHVSAGFRRSVGLRGRHERAGARRRCPHQFDRCDRAAHRCVGARGLCQCGICHYQRDEELPHLRRGGEAEIRADAISRGVFGVRVLQLRSRRTEPGCCRCPGQIPAARHSCRVHDLHRAAEIARSKTTVSVRTYTLSEIVNVIVKRRWLILVPLALGIAIAPLLARYAPERYRSEALIVVIPQQVPDDFVKPTVSEIGRRAASLNYRSDSQSLPA